MGHSEGTFAIISWDEETLMEGEGQRRIVRAHVKRKFSGALEGEGSIEYLMAYSSDGQAAFVGLELVEGSLEGARGSFVFQHVGTFEEGISSAAMTVIPGSGTGDLIGLTGEGNFSVSHAEEYPFIFEYTFPG